MSDDSSWGVGCGWCSSVGVLVGVAASRGKGCVRLGMWLPVGNVKAGSRGVPWQGLC